MLVKNAVRVIDEEGRMLAVNNDEFRMDAIFDLPADQAKFREWATTKR